MFRRMHSNPLAGIVRVEYMVSFNYTLTLLMEHSMKKWILGSMFCLLASTSAFATDVNLGINVGGGEPPSGSLSIGEPAPQPVIYAPQPVFVTPQPVIVERPESYDHHREHDRRYWEHRREEERREREHREHERHERREEHHDHDHDHFDHDDHR